MGKKLEGKKCPRFNGASTNDNNFSNKDFIGKKLIIYFYPKDSTPGCTTQGQDFRENFKTFKKLNTEILGVSRDSVKSHENFKAKESFPFELISDPEEKICNQYNVIKEKSMYGRKYMGIERSTFLIDEKGKLVQEWRKVKVTGHAQEVLDTIKAMK